MHCFETSCKYLYIQSSRVLLGMDEAPMEKLAVAAGSGLTAQYFEGMDGEESESHLQKHAQDFHPSLHQEHHQGYVRIREI